MIKYAVIDLESIPSTTLPEGVKPEFDRGSVKLGNIKDPIKQEEKIELAHMDFRAELDKKMSLDPDLCEVVCCGIYHSELDQAVIYGQKTNSVLIKNVWEMISQIYLDHIPLVSYNGIGFDLPVLLHAALRENVPVDPEMYKDLTRKYENKFHYDLMQWFSNWDRTKWKPLDFYLKLFNIGEKTGEGSDVCSWWKSGDYEKIRLHCETDVKVTAKLFERVQQWIVKED